MDFLGIGGSAKLPADALPSTVAPADAVEREMAGRTMAPLLAPVATLMTASGPRPRGRQAPHHPGRQQRPEAGRHRLAPAVASPAWAGGEVIPGPFGSI
jgi:hypothetical protein